jgi:hypothetical protein
VLNALGMGVSAIGGLPGNSAARRAGRAQQAGLAQGQNFLSDAQAGYTPYTQFGQNALGRLSAVEGGDYSAFENAPDYQFALDQSMRANDRSAAARGSLYSGGADADRMQLASGLASQNLQNYLGRMMGQAGMGMQAQGAVSNILGQRAGLAVDAGNAAAGTAMQRGQNWQNTLGNVWSFGSDWLGGNSLGKQGKGY